LEGQKIGDIFNDIELGEYKNLMISTINFDKKAKKITIALKTNAFFEYKKIAKIEETIANKFALEQATIEPKFEGEKLKLEDLVNEWDNILFRTFKFSPGSKMVLRDSKVKIENGKLIACLDVIGKDLLKIRKADILIEGIINNTYGVNCKVDFIEDANIKVPDAKINLPEEMKNYSTDEIKEIKKVMSNIKAKEEKPQTIVKNDDENLILGKKRFVEEISSISSVTAESDKIALEGKVIAIETREIKSGKILVMFDITDFSNSITVKFFAEKAKFEEIEPKLKKGIWVRVLGNAQYDKFTREVSVFANGIYKVEHIGRQDLSESKRVELHLHTQMSAMDGVSSASDLVKRAAEWGHKAIAITDHGVLQGYPEAYAAGKKNNIKIIYGVEGYLVDDTGIDPEELDIKKTKTYHIIILVKNYVGLKNLYHLVSDAHLKYFYKRPRMLRSLIEKYREGLIIASACEAGELYRAVVAGEPDQKLESIASFYDYLEIQPVGNNLYMIRAGMAKDEEQIRDFNRKIVSIADKLNKKVIATGDVHFLDPWDEVFRRILMAGQGFSDADNQAPLYLKTTNEMLDEFSYLGTDKAYEVVVRTPNEIADMVEELEPIPQKTYPPSIEGAEEQIEQLSWSKAKELYGENLPKIVKDRLDKELNSIIKNGFSVMYIIAQKLVWKSLSDGYLVGSRGSVGSSFVATMTGITEVNPLPAHYLCPNCKHSEFPNMAGLCGCDMPKKDCPECGTEMQGLGYDIPFETFLGFDGDKEPDIDLNFSGDYQPVAHKYTEELFGVGHVFRAGTIATIAEKTAYGFVKKYIDSKEQVLYNAEINRLSAGCSGVRRTTGQHPGGVIVVPADKEIYDFCPIQRPADDVGTDIITTHFDYHFIHGTLLKLDILGHDDPTVIRMLEDLTGLDAKTIPIGDPATMDLFLSTKSLGIKPEDIHSEVGTFAVPEFGTKFVRQMLIDTKPKTFSELIRISGLSHGTDVWLGNAQDLIKAGTATLPEVICARDDIMIYLIDKGLVPKTAFKIMEDVRKGKGLKPEYEDAMRENNVPEWYIDSCKKIKYMFPKAHAAAYVMMAFRIAYFKVHYPEAFYTTFFTVRGDDFDQAIMTHGKEMVEQYIKEYEEKGNNVTAKEKGTLSLLEVVNEMYARGIKFLPIDIYDSEATKFQIREGGILPPFNSIQGMGNAAAQSIVDARKDGKFSTIDDFQMRTKVSKTLIEVMEQAGCFEGIPKSNQISMF